MSLHVNIGKSIQIIVKLPQHEANTHIPQLGETKG